MFGSNRLFIVLWCWDRVTRGPVVLRSSSPLSRAICLKGVAQASLSKVWLGSPGPVVLWYWGRASSTVFANRFMPALHLPMEGALPPPPPLLFSAVHFQTYEFSQHMNLFASVGPPRPPPLPPRPPPPLHMKHEPFPNPIMRAFCL